MSTAQEQLPSDGLRARHVTQASIDSTASESTQAQSNNDGKDKKTFGRTPDGTSAYHFFPMDQRTG
jgi:hypothetical protein